MLLGHFSLALAAKKILRKASLGRSVLSVQLADTLGGHGLSWASNKCGLCQGSRGALPAIFSPIQCRLACRSWCGAFRSAGYIFYADATFARRWLSTLLPAEWLLDYLAHRPDLSDPGLRRCPARAANERYG